MYFVQKNEEIHLSFKNSEKQQTQALIDISFILQCNNGASCHKLFSGAYENFRKEAIAASFTLI